MTQPESQPWDENELVMISALEHWAYCPRQCALIHVEQTFDENIYTLRGRFLHERADQPVAEVRQGVRIERAMPLWSDRLGLIGKADVVEFRGPAVPGRIQAWPPPQWGGRAPVVCPGHVPGRNDRPGGASGGSVLPRRPAAARSRPYGGNSGPRNGSRLSRRYGRCFARPGCRHRCPIPVAETVRSRNRACRRSSAGPVESAT